MAMEQQNYFNLQDTFLNHLRRNRIPLTLFLSNGVKMQGIIVSFDNFSVMLKKDNYFQFVYKHAISTIVPSGKFDIQEMLGNNNPERCTSNRNNCNISDIECNDEER